MSHKRLTPLPAIAFLLLAACGGSSPTASNTPTSTPPAALTPSSAPVTPSSIDPCQLVTSAEASKLAGASFGAGKEETTTGTGRICVYGAQTLNVFTVSSAVAPDAATAQADWEQEKSKAQASLADAAGSAGATVKMNLSDVTLSGADKASVATASATISGQNISITGIYVLKGAVFFSFSDLVLGKAAPTPAAMEAQAQTVLTRLP